MFNLSPAELKVLKKLSTPIKIQDYLDALPINWEKNGETCMSPRRVLCERKAHCMEGAMLAAAALWLRGQEPLLLDLKTNAGDDHVVALYRVGEYWGAISKTNHATVRFRDPVYRTVRELAISYFHEYFNEKTGYKMLRSFSARPFRLRRYGDMWVTAEDDLFQIAKDIDRAAHARMAPPGNIRRLRLADPMELKAGRLIEWKKSDRGT